MVPATPGQHSHIVVGERVLQTIAVTTYVCTQCGFVEQWVNNQADLLVLKIGMGLGGRPFRVRVRRRDSRTARGFATAAPAVSSCAPPDETGRMKKKRGPRCRGPRRSLSRVGWA